MLSCWKNHQIAEYLDWTERTVRQTIHRWQAQGLVGLFDAARPGRKPRWQEKGLYLFFLPKYCSQMNAIEPEWHQLYYANRWRTLD
jgi:transposase